MEQWEHDFWKVNLHEFMRKEYKKLLQIEKTNEQAEELLLFYCHERLASNETAVGQYHVALALAEWNMGRLSSRVKERAISSIPILNGVLDDIVLSEIHKKLLSPLPPEVSVAKARVRHCPWREGSLLAYRIQNSELTRQSRYWNKYVLLRVIKLVQWPFCQLAPDECFSETMLVGLYDWYGDVIPALEKIEQLKFITISESPAAIRLDQVEQNSLQKLSAANETAANQFVTFLTKPRVENCFSLRWDRTSRKDGTFTLLDCDPDFPRPDFAFKTNLTDYAMGGVRAFDACLCYRLEELYGK